MLLGTEYQSRTERQRCKVCWNADGFDFTVPDEVWAAVVPLELREVVVCLRCFDDFAAERRIDYTSHLGAIYFSGSQVAMEFRRVG